MKNFENFQIEQFDKAQTWFLELKPLIVSGDTKPVIQAILGCTDYYAILIVEALCAVSGMPATALLAHSMSLDRHNMDELFIKAKSFMSMKELARISQDIGLVN